MPFTEALPKAEEMVMKALELDNTLAEARTVMGRVKVNYYWDWVEAGKEHQLAIELDPNSAGVHSSYARYLGWMGRFDEAIPLMKRAQQLDPLGTRIPAAQLFTLARRYDEAIEQFQVLLDLQRNLPGTYSVLAEVYESQGLHEEAATALHQSLVLGGASEEDVAGLLDAAASGAESYWRWRLDYETERAKRRYVGPAQFALIYAQLGEKDEAFEWLEKAFEERETISSLKVNPDFDTLRDDPRFHDLLRRMNLEP